MTAMARNPGGTVQPRPMAAPGMVTDAIVVERWSDGITETASDMVAAERPVSLDYNGISHAVMLASPADLEDFATGFSLTEGIVDHRRQILDLEVVERHEGLQLRITIAAACFHRLKLHRRSMAGRTGCGLCGTESLSQVFRPLAPVTAPAVLAPLALQRALEALVAAQPLQHLTGATHAAGWLDGSGHLTAIREDVGRHNALDKLIGSLALAEADFSTGTVVITSRASSEMIQKAASMGIGVVAAMGAPTSLAIRMAEHLNLTLLGFARHNRHVLYTGAHRVAGHAIQPGDAP